MSLCIRRLDYLFWAKWATHHLTHHLTLPVLFFSVSLYIRRTEWIEFPVFIFTYAVAFFAPRRCRALGVFGDDAYFVWIMLSCIGKGSKSCQWSGGGISQPSLSRAIINLLLHCVTRPHENWPSGLLFPWSGWTMWLAIVSAVPIKWLDIHAVTSLFSSQPAATSPCRFSHLEERMGGLPEIDWILNITHCKTR